MASGSMERSRSCVTVGEPRHNVDRSEMTVDTLGEALVSGFMVDFGDLLGRLSDVLPPSPTFINRARSSWISPWLAKGAGSTERRVKRSAKEAKQRSAPSDTYNIIEIKVHWQHLTSTITHL